VGRWAGPIMVLVWGVFCVVSSSALGFALSNGRVYELASPVYKEGFGVDEIQAVAPDGESVAFSSRGAFAQTPGPPSSVAYLARRGEVGWSTVSLVPPAAIAPNPAEFDYSETLDSSLTLGVPAPNHGIARVEGDVDEFLLHSTVAPDSNAFWEIVGVPLQSELLKHLPVDYQSASANFCHIVFSGPALLPEAENPGIQLYELTGRCDGEPQLRFVALNNKGKLISPRCLVELGEGALGHIEDLFNAVAAGGDEVFFTTNVDAVKGTCSGPKQVFVRLGASRTLELSRPLEVSKPFGGCGTVGEVPCPGGVTREDAEFAGANEAGTTMFFTSRQQLVGEDKDEENDLYMARIGCPGGVEGCATAEREMTSLTLVSHAVNSGEAGDVQGVVRVAPDGSRVYFVARGALSEAPNAEGHAPRRGADNLYVYDDVSGRLAFIADLCSGPALSGEAEDLGCPVNLEAQRSDEPMWVRPQGEAQTAGGDGRFLVFSSYGQLTTDDTDTANDVYRYDAATGALQRVSVGEAGSDANGNNNRFDARIANGHRGGRVYWQYEMDKRAISEDGSRIAFTTADPLVPAAVNGLTNVYEWREQPGSSEVAVSLISSGSAEEPDPQAVISPSGRDVFFLTAQGLVEQDTDAANDVYDARLGGGFPPSPAPRQPCSSDSCQGPLTNPAPLLVPGSASQLPGQNLKSPPKHATKTRKAKPKKRRVKKKRRTSPGRRGKARR
jgi:hypothetical protein